MSNVTPIPVSGVTSMKGEPMSLRASTCPRVHLKGGLRQAIERANGGQVVQFTRGREAAVRRQTTPMITNVTPMSVEHARCLEMAYQLHRLLGELNDRPENGEGSIVEQASDLVDQVIEYLEPSAFEGTEPGPLIRSVRRRALHSLARKRWRP